MSRLPRPSHARAASGALLALASVAALAAVAEVARAAPAMLPAAAQDPTDDALREAWKKLEDGEKTEVIAWFSAEVGYLGTFQQKLIGHVLQSVDRDPFDWPEAEDPPVYDPEVHAPAQPIARRPLKRTARAYEAFRAKIFRKVPERKLRSAWTYDYATRDVRRLAAKDDPERIFENALAGYPPNLDLAEALVERLLDDGSLQKQFAALGHAYADRGGNTYPDITLYDVWGSGIEMEMPDVECLGIIHDIEDDWRTWVAPIPPAQHDALYERIGKIFERARDHRNPRSAFARLYLTGRPALIGGYGAHVDRFHTLWDVNESKPEKLAEALPKPADLVDWLEKEGKRIDTNGDLYTRGPRRRAALEADSAKVRATLVGVLREFGALGKKD